MNEWICPYCGYRRSGEVCKGCGYLRTEEDRSRDEWNAILHHLQCMADLPSCQDVADYLDQERTVLEEQVSGAKKLMAIVFGVIASVFYVVVEQGLW